MSAMFFPRSWTRPVSGYVFLLIGAFALACIYLRGYQLKLWAQEHDHHVDVVAPIALSSDETTAAAVAASAPGRMLPLSLNTYGLLTQDLLRKSVLNVGMCGFLSGRRPPEFGSSLLSALCAVSLVLSWRCMIQTRSPAPLCCSCVTFWHCSVRMRC